MHNVGTDTVDQYFLQIFYVYRNKRYLKYQKNEKKCIYLYIIHTQDMVWECPPPSSRYCGGWWYYYQCTGLLLQVLELLLSTVVLDSTTH